MIVSEARAFSAPQKVCDRAPAGAPQRQRSHRRDRPDHAKDAPSANVACSTSPLPPELKQKSHQSFRYENTRPFRKILTTDRSRESPPRSWPHRATITRPDHRYRVGFPTSGSLQSGPIVDSFEERPQDLLRIGSECIDLEIVFYPVDKVGPFERIGK